MAKQRFSLNSGELRRSNLRESYCYSSTTCAVRIADQSAFSSYKRSTNPKGKGKKPEILETKSDISYEYSKTVRASDEGIYEVISIKDKYCAFSTHKSQGKSGQKLLT